MADYTREVARWLERIATEERNQTKYLKDIRDAMNEKQFSEFPPPPIGKVLMNENGFVCMHREDFDALYADALAYREQGEETEKQGVTD